MYVVVSECIWLSQHIIVVFFPFLPFFSFLHMQQATSLICEMFTIARQHIIKYWNERSRQMLLGIRKQRNQFGLGKALQRKGVKWGLKKIWLGTGGQFKQQFMLWAKGKSQNESGLFQRWSGNCLLWIWVGDEAGEVDWESASVACRPETSVLSPDSHVSLASHWTF